MLLYHSCIASHPLGIVSTKSSHDTPADEFGHQETIAVFVDIKPEPYEESNTGLPDIVTELYAAANDGDSPLTAQREREEEELEEALDAQEAQSKTQVALPVRRRRRSKAKGSSQAIASAACRRRTGSIGEIIHMRGTRRVELTTSLANI